MKQVRFAMDYGEIRGDFRAPAVSPNTPVENNLRPEEGEFAPAMAAATRDTGNELEEVSREEATVEELIMDAFQSCIDQGWVTQRHGPWMKKKISRILGLGDEPNTQGNLLSQIEIKTTITDQRGGYNFVQIRPDTKDHLYFCFDTNASSSAGAGAQPKLYVFALFSREMKAILPRFGSYAHGSIKLFGPITHDNIDPKKEHAIRPNPRDTHTCRNGRAWTYFINNYLIEANKLPEFLATPSA
jgi:hypothetical protein